MRAVARQIFQVFTSIRLYTVGLYVPPEVIVFFSVYKVRPAPGLLATAPPRA